MRTTRRTILPQELKKRGLDVAGGGNSSRCHNPFTKSDRKQEVEVMLATAKKGWSV